MGVQPLSPGRIEAARWVLFIPQELEALESTPKYSVAGFLGLVPKVPGGAYHLRASEAGGGKGNHPAILSQDIQVEVSARDAASSLGLTRAF